MITVIFEDKVKVGEQKLYLLRRLWNYKQVVCINKLQ